jgi:hypothetical protein
MTKNLDEMVPFGDFFVVQLEELQMQWGQFSHDWHLRIQFKGLCSAWNRSTLANCGMNEKETPPNQSLLLSCVIGTSKSPIHSDELRNMECGRKTGV